MICLYVWFTLSKFSSPTVELFFHASTFLLPVSVNKSDVCDDGMRSSPAVGGDIDKNASLLGLQFWLGSGSDLVLK